jgi:hypothetical protein
MLRLLPEKWPAEVAIAPYSGIQFLDFGFDVDQIGRGSSAFSERFVEARETGEVWRLHPRTGDDALDAEIPPARRAGEEDYAISKTRALEPFLRKWIPAPVLRLRLGAKVARGGEAFDAGPSTWARLYVLELDERDPATGHTHRVVLALDTDLDDAPEEPDAPYLAPTVKDAAEESVFRLVSDPDQMAWFLRRPVTEADGAEVDPQKWVDDWLSEAFLAFKQAQRPGKELRPEDLPYRFEHWARYIALLKMLGEAIRPPRLRLLDTVSEDARYATVDVDFVIDLGSSRTCGILVENYPDARDVDLTNAYSLSLRDLGRPELHYRRPFESRIEFARADFGPEHIARRSGRARPAFLWPSMLRVGPEATRLLRASEGTETVSGLSSPKRYLWDVSPVSQDWRFHGADTRQSLPLVARSAFRFLNEAGDVIAQARDEEQRKLRSRGESSAQPAIRPRFSRSALYGLMLSEMIAHALQQINDPAMRATRKQSDLPRRLRTVILTLPSATPLQEQAIMRSRAEGALRLTWAILGWNAAKPATCRPPEVIVDWDEASCTQLVWLYDEIAQKFGGQIEAFFRLVGQPRRRSAETAGRGGGARAEPSLRVACIDVGGGTTDLMVTTYFSEDNRAIRPVQTAREGFRVAGDDLVEAVIARSVLPQLAERIAAAGGTYAEELLRELFAGDVGDVAEQTRQRRRQFALQVLTPAALAILEASEALRPGETRQLALVDVVGAKPQPPHDPESEEPPPPPELAVASDVLAYLEDAANGRGARDFALAGVTLEANARAVEDAAREVLGPPLEAMLEIVDHLDVDVLLLSGRPTRLPAVREMAREALALRPDRIVAMHEYKVGSWYPYRDRVSNRIGDPKTTAAVGAMLCLLASSRIVNFKLHAEELIMRSTARYIGEMERDGRIRAQRVLFSDVDLARRGGDEAATVRLRAPIHIGFRQLAHERWMASPLYRLDFGNEQAKRRRGPLAVTIARRETDGDAESHDQKLRAEALKEAFVIETVEDADGAACLISDVRLALHTLGVDETAYWLDTGVFRIG